MLDAALYAPRVLHFSAFHIDRFYESFCCSNKILNKEFELVSIIIEVASILSFSSAAEASELFLEDQNERQSYWSEVAIEHKKMVMVIMEDRRLEKGNFLHKIIIELAAIAYKICPIL